MNLSILPESLAICRLSPEADVPDWAMLGEFVSITHTRDELSIVCAEENVPSDVKADWDWRALKVEGPLDLALTGILASLANPLAEAKIKTCLPQHLAGAHHIVPPHQQIVSVVS